MFGIGYFELLVLGVLVVAVALIAAAAAGKRKRD
jgi:hypothetical protein